jgi:uncharacterized membrane protein
MRETFVIVLVVLAVVVLALVVLHAMEYRSVFRRRRPPEP